MTSTPMLFNSGKDIDLYITRLHMKVKHQKERLRMHEFVAIDEATKVVKKQY